MALLYGAIYSRKGVLIVAKPERKKCSKCQKTKKASEFRVRKDRGSTYLYYMCIDCERLKSRGYNAANAAKIRARKEQKMYDGPRHEDSLTTMNDRKQDGHRCLALDILAIAVADEKVGLCEPEFWGGDLFQLCCEIADLHPEWILRGVKDMV